MGEPKCLSNENPHRWLGDVTENYTMPYTEPGGSSAGSIAKEPAAQPSSPERTQILCKMSSPGLRLLRRWFSPVSGRLHLVIFPPRLFLIFFPTPCSVSGSNSLLRSHLVVTTYVLKCAIRRLMYGVFCMVTRLVLPARQPRDEEGSCHLPKCCLPMETAMSHLGPLWTQLGEGRLSQTEWPPPILTGSPGAQRTYLPAYSCLCLLN